MRIDVSFYAIIDEDFIRGREVSLVARELVLTGVTVLQYRAKKLSSRQFLSRALAIESAVRGSGIPLIINDRMDIALLCSASGVHLGSEDVPIGKAREILGPERIIGVTVRSPDEAIMAENEGADYVGAGAVFPSATKRDVTVIGLDTVREIKSSVRIPVVAIGGLGLQRVSQVMSTGVDGLAFVSELFESQEIGERAKQLRAAIDASKRNARS